MVFTQGRLKIVALTGIALLHVGVTQSGCTSMSRTQQGVMIGGLGGAAAGTMIGGKKSAGKGALIGGILGAASGGLIGNYMDKQAQELASVAEVQRSEDGIRVTMRDKILFDTGQSMLKPESRNGLIKIADVIKKYDKTGVAIVGHTDNVGSASYNQGLSERRQERMLNIQKIIKVLSEHNVNFVVIGGTAAIVKKSYWKTKGLEVTDRA